LRPGPGKGQNILKMLDSGGAMKLAARFSETVQDIQYWLYMYQKVAIKFNAAYLVAILVVLNHHLLRLVPLVQAEHMNCAQRVDGAGCDVGRSGKSAACETLAGVGVSLRAFGQRGASVRVVYDFGPCAFVASSGFFGLPLCRDVRRDVILDVASAGFGRVGWGSLCRVGADLLRVSGCLWGFVFF
jgi:hypothetical protein